MVQWLRLCTSKVGGAGSIPGPGTKIIAHAMQCSQTNLLFRFLNIFKRKVYNVSLLKVICGCSVAQSCLTLCTFMDCSPPGSSAHGFPRQEYRSALLFPTPGDLLDPGIKPVSLASLALAGRLSTTEPPGKPIKSYTGN